MLSWMLCIHILLLVTSKCSFAFELLVVPLTIINFMFNSVGSPFLVAQIHVAEIKNKVLQDCFK